MIMFPSVASTKTRSFLRCVLNIKMTTVPSALCNLADYALG